MSIRPATVTDYPVFVRLFDELGLSDPVPSVQTWTDTIAPHAVFLEQGGKVAGYIHFQLFDGLGYIRHVVVDPGHRGQGVGRRLMQHVAHRVREAGLNRWCLNVKSDNVPAVRLYESMGMSFKHASVAVRMGWDIIERLPSPGPDIVTTTLPSADEAAVERALALPSGIISQRRKRDGVLLLLARQDDTPIGLSVFDPDFPGGYPFRARDLAVARSLLEAMHPHANPVHSYVQLVFEDAPDLAHAFEEVGATRHLSFVHFMGEVPQST